MTETRATLAYISAAVIAYASGQWMGHRQWYFDIQPDDSGSLHSCQTAAAAIQGYLNGESIYTECEKAILSETLDEKFKADRLMRGDHWSALTFGNGDDRCVW